MEINNPIDTDLFFSALADRTRLRLLNLMTDGEVCVCFFAEVLDTNNPKISRHLAYLRRAKLVAGRRDGKWMHYRVTPLSDDRLAVVFDATVDLLRNDPEMQEDSQKLAAFACLPSMLVPIGRSII